MVAWGLPDAGTARCVFHKTVVSAFPGRRSARREGGRRTREGRTRPATTVLRKAGWSRVTTIVLARYAPGEPREQHENPPLTDSVDPGWGRPRRARFP